MIFRLSGKARDDRRQTLGPWEVELRKDSDHVAVRSAITNLSQPLDDVIESAYDVAQHLLNIVAVENRDAPGSTNPVDDFLNARYSAIPCAAFHAKPSTSNVLLPGMLADEGAMLGAV